MFYLLPTAVIGLLGYMFWMAGFRLRQDRIRFARDDLRRRFRRERLRRLVAQAYNPMPERPEWHALLSRLGGENPQRSREST